MAGNPRNFYDEYPELSIEGFVKTRPLRNHLLNGLFKFASVRIEPRASHRPAPEFLRKPNTDVDVLFGNVKEIQIPVIVSAETAGAIFLASL